MEHFADVRRRDEEKLAAMAQNARCARVLAARPAQKVAGSAPSTASLNALGVFSGMLWTASALGALHGPPSIRSHRVATPALSLAADCFASELAAARQASREIRELLADASHPEEVELLIAQAQQVAEVELTNEGANYRGGTWVTHLDEHVFSIALVDREHGPVVGVVHRRATDETISASKNDGAWLASGDDDADGWEARAGNASPHAQVLHVPSGSCHALDVALDSIGLAMPVTVQRVPGCCCCEGLFELVAGRADVHVTPPAELAGNLQAPPTPRALLCAFAVLLDEAGGALSDAYGQELDFSLDVSGENSAAFAAPRHDRGLLATEGESINFFKRFTRSAFEDAAAGLEFWEADLRRHTGAPPGDGGGGAAERMRARLSKLMGNDDGGGERNS